MDPIQNSSNLPSNNEEENALLAMQLSSIVTLPFVLRSAVDLSLFEIMAESGPTAHLCPSEIASKLPTGNPVAPMVIERLLRFLASYSIISCKIAEDDGGQHGYEKRLYGLAPVCKYFVRDEDDASFAPLMMLLSDNVVTNAWYHLRDAIQGGSTMIEEAYGVPIFEFMAKNKRYQKLFNEAMRSHSRMIMKKILENYKGFGGLNEVVDVGGGLGASLALIVSKYPQIKAINFDLPHVVKDAPHIPGVETVGGDMFAQVPHGEAIFMKWILHDWDDEKCLKILRNCLDAIPKSGKVIVVESVIPELPKTDIATKNSLCLDIGMMGSTKGGKERTQKEFEGLAREAGFTHTSMICRVYSYWVIEFYKN